MDEAVRRTFESALMLPEEEREALAAALLASLSVAADERLVDASWKAEVRRRVEELDRGSVQPLEWDAARRVIFGP